MNDRNALAGFLSGLVLTAALVAACSSGSSDPGPMGMAAIVIRDGAVQSSDGRTVTSVFVEISRITLRTDGDDDQHQGMSDDGDDDEHEDDDDEHEDDDDDEIEVVVFDMFRDNGGVPREVDLLTLTDSGVLLNMLRIPVGTYDEARVTLVGAAAIFEDDATQTPVPLVIEGGDDGKFEIDFEPPVEVTETGTTVAAIDIVPVITLEGTTYTLSNDGDSDHSGECGDGELEVELEGTVTSVNGSLIQLGNIPLDIDLSGLDPVLVAPGMEVEVSGYFENGVLVATSFEFED